MQFTLLSALAFAAVSLADSDLISFMLLRSGTEYHFSSIYVLDGVLSLNNEGTAVEGKILDNGKFEFNDGSYLVVGSDGSLTTTTSADEASSPFSISNSYFEYQDSQAFNVNLDQSLLLFGSGENPTAVGATDRSGTSGFAPDFSPSGDSSNSSSITSEIVSSSTAPTGYFNSTSTTTEGSPSTTIVTITSCSEDKCSESTVTTGVTVVTTTSQGVVTEYTTYCPLTSESTTVAPPVTTSTPAPTSTTAPTSKTTVLSSSGTTEPTASTFDNGAAALSGAGALAAVAAALLI